MRRLLVAIAAMAACAIAPTAASAASLTDPIGDILQRIDAVASAALKAPQWLMKATLYHAGKGIRARDSMGCKVVPMRTLAVDPRIVPKGSVVFIKETVGLEMPDGHVHDGLWYASDVGGAIKGQRIDLYTGAGSTSMRPLEPLNLHELSVTPVSTFEGCPPAS